MQHTFQVAHASDVSMARRVAQAMAMAIGFDETVSAEVAIAVSELASNLVKHAGSGVLTLTPLAEGGRVGLQIESQDRGPGIADVEQALTDGFSTVGSLGYGLGAVNRLMDAFDITSPREARGGTRIVCTRWLRADERRLVSGPLTFGAATRPHPRMAVNGDAFVIKQWGESALVGVIDGLGHGQFAHRAAQTARQYVESHFDQPLSAIFQGAGRACQATRGVVMALARFDQAGTWLSFASIGNIEVRVFDSPEPLHFMIRRGIVGANAPPPVVTEHRWEPSNVMVLHSDGVTTHWRWEDVARLAPASATVMAQQLLQTLAKDIDDATVVVVKGRGTLCPSADTVAERRGTLCPSADTVAERRGTLCPSADTVAERRDNAS
jgi:anti-sigma regulatory factor (Ser/Thr protein kinase)/serine/threonine protein phosphatase PrpC